jgi:hypothetical protein
MTTATETGWLYKGVCYQEWSQAQDQYMSYAEPVKQRAKISRFLG